MKRDPLLLFLILGGALYGAWTLLAPNQLETIRVEASTLRALEEYQEDLLGRPLTEEEKEEIQEGFIDDEVLLREALERGLQWSDGRVRQRLTRIMRGALTETVADPSVAQLQAYFRDNIDRYATPESRTFEQVFFAWGDDVADAEIEASRSQLQAGADPESFPARTTLVRPVMPRETRPSLVRTFGAAFADAVEQLPLDAWSEPIESVQGIHLVRVVERHPPEVPTFEDLESYLRQDWLMTRTRELQQAGIDEMRSKYEIEIVEESTGE